MKITDIKTQILTPEVFIKWKKREAPFLGQNKIIRIFTDEGIEGNSMRWWVGSERLIETVSTIKSRVIGEDPLDRERIWEKMVLQGPIPDKMSLCAIDIALWDIAGKATNLPIYKLLGAYRDKVRAYGSSIFYDTVQEYVDEVVGLKKKGYTAYKIHPWGIPEKDVEICRAVREAVGDKMTLMLDPYCSYDLKDAIKVGREIEKLDFYWYEEPLPITDIDGYMNLRKALSMPIVGGETITSFGQLAWYLKVGVFDRVRPVGDWGPGITGSKKIASLCEAFNVNFEVHSFGPSMFQAANLHVILAIKNCDFFEMPVPEGMLDVAMKDTINVDKDGFVHAPKKPGLGLDIDWDEAEKLTFKIV